MIVQTAVIITAIKVLFIPLYHSTDFEVHRNWLAVTYNKSVSEWYYDTRSEWTLDYPPLFAWFEYFLAHIAKFIDPKMLQVDNVNYASEMTVLFQRLSVILLDTVYLISVKSCSSLIVNGKLLVFLLLLSNPGLLMVDHIHFQYNGFLFGILLISISHMIKANYLKSAFWFAVLLNFKHIFLYIAPVYVIYLLRAYCLTVISKDGVHTAWYSFSLKRFMKLAITVLLVFIVSFGPFIFHLPQVFSRLFPFKRGLCHAYWAPNFWAIYNFIDKILQHALIKLGYSFYKSEASMTGGLVQEYDHIVLPTIKPIVTFLLTTISMVPALKHLWYLGADKKYRAVNFVRCLIICATCSFMFGWHVHEKAIIIILIPLSFMAVLGDVDGKLFLIFSVVGHYSLFPLLYPKNLLPIKIFILLTHSSIAFYNIPKLYENPKLKNKKRRFLCLPMLNALESLYLYGLILLCIYDNALHVAWGIDKHFPFMPLMLTSIYCTLGVLYFWISYYYYFLTFNLSSNLISSSENATTKKSN